MFLSRLMKNRKMRSGQAIVIIALSMVVLLAIVALGIDGSKFYSERRVAQNAADEAALAGVYLYSSNIQNSIATTDSQVLVEVDRVAELDQIPDPDGIPNDGVNGHVPYTAWLKTDGTVLLSPIPNTSAAPPVGAAAIKVQVDVPYPTFLGGFVGHPNVDAIADASARIVLNTVPPPNVFPPDVYVGGGICTTLTDAIAFNYHNKNNNHFPEGFSVNGSLNVDTVGGNASGSPIQVQGISGNNRQITSPPPSPAGSANPLPSPAFSPYQYLGPSTGNPNPTYPYTIKSKNVTYPLETVWFNPNVTSGPWGTNAPGVLGSPLLAAYTATGNGPVVYIAGDAALGQSGAETSISSYVSAHPTQSGIFYVDGNLTVGGGGWTGWTLVVRDRFLTNGNNSHFGTAGPWAYNFSVFAGGDLGGPSGTAQDTTADTNDPLGRTYFDYKRCATDETNAILEVNGNRTVFDGVLFIPHGESFFYGNNHVAGGAPDLGGIITYSFRLGQEGSGVPANNWQFDFLPNMPALPSIIVQLMGN